VAPAATRRSPRSAAKRSPSSKLDALVQHFRREAQHEGKDFPEEGTATFVQLRNQLLGLLVYRAELKQGAERLGAPSVTPS
jgi:hypothetical protein